VVCSRDQGFTREPWNEVPQSADEFYHIVGTWYPAGPHGEPWALARCPPPRQTPKPKEVWYAYAAFSLSFLRYAVLANDCAVGDGSCVRCFANLLRKLKHRESDAAGHSVNAK